MWGKFLVRCTIVITAVYFVLSYLAAQILCIDILTPLYNILLESCIVVYSFSEGKYHCRYIKYTALAILLSEIVTQTDNMFDYLTTGLHNYIPLVLIILGVATGVTLAIRHYVRVIKVKRLKQNGII